MKIRNANHSPNTNTEQAQSVDITELFIQFQEKYRNVFIEKIEDEIFIYRSLGRMDYKKIISDERFNNMEKEEIICQICVLWPENYDFENCDAGIPTVLTKRILRNSFLDSVESRRNILDFYRQEMFDLDNQISCIIHEAFPQFDLEEIESWDVEKTTKYLSRAEWKLHHLRGLPFVDPYEGQSLYEQQDAQNNAEQKNVQTEEVGVPETKSNARGGKKEKLTPEKLRELKEKFPEIPWEQDTVLNEGIEGMKDSVDTTPPALRPGF